MNSNITNIMPALDSAGQSAGQVSCSPSSHMLFPHVVNVVDSAQSAGHVIDVSPISQMLFPHSATPILQSTGQLVALSPESQMLFPQNVVGDCVDSPAIANTENPGEVEVKKTL